MAEISLPKTTAESKGARPLQQQKGPGPFCWEIRLETLPRLAVLAGPAGIGKTHFCLENFSRLLHESSSLFTPGLLYILPSAEHRERIVDLMLRNETRGFFGERVTTFNRLMKELLERGGMPLVTDAQRRFLLEEIVKEKPGNYFSAVHDLAGFLEKLAEFVGELKDSLVGLDDFHQRVQALERVRPEVREKYRALFQIYEAYENRLEGMGAKDHRDGLFLLREKIRQGKFSRIHFRHLFLDGFFDFSKAQLEFLAWLCERSQRVTLTLTVDCSREAEGLFAIPLETLRELKGIGFEAVALEGKTNHRSISPGLRHVERNLFRSPLPPHPIPLPLGEGGSPLLILEATGIRGEIEMIARRIRRLVGRAQGPLLHYSDIALILRRIGPYEGVLRSVFRQFQIPVEIHEREKLKDSPLARTLRSFFKILLEDWKREDLFNFLKSSYVEKDYEEVCVLEIRGSLLGILSGKERWLREIGGPLFEKISAFQEGAKEERSVEEWIRFTREVITSFGMDRIPRLYEETARRDFLALKRLEALLQEIRRGAFSRKDLRGSFQAFAGEFLSLIEVDLFSLHEREKNRVQVYDVSLARQKEYKVVFLAGLLEKQFPLQIREDPILSDEERRIAGLPQRLPRQALERYLFYVGFTRAREKVILTYPRFNLEGQEALPSFYVDEIKRLFPKDSIPQRSYPVNQPLPLLEDLVEEREIEAWLVAKLYDKSKAGNQSQRLLTLVFYNRLIERPSFQSLLPKILYEPLALIQDERVRAAFFPKNGIFKPTGLETYGRCPYRYFASQVLHLEEKEEGIDAREVGKILHEVLKDYFEERYRKGNGDLGNLERAKKFVAGRLHELLQKNPLVGAKGYQIELKIQEMEKWLCALVEKEIEGETPLAGLQPQRFELSFGFAPKNDYLKLYDPLREEMKLRGQIDRIDVDSSGRYGLVIDYKTGGSFKFQDLLFGKSLQLPLYLLALQKIFKLKPLGGEIYQIKGAERKGFYSKEGLQEIKTEPPSKKNVYERGDFEKILERSVRFSSEFADGITRAQIPVRPRDCDSHCPFPSLCRIEKWRLPFIYQEIREEDERTPP